MNGTCALLVNYRCYSHLYVYISFTMFDCIVPNFQGAPFSPICVFKNLEETIFVDQGFC